MSLPPPTVNRLEAERAELDALLGSELFGRTSNPVRFLVFVCERYFAGTTDSIKEYSIAVEALGRPQDFDPQSDTIVRVTAHALRKRMEDYYRSAGARHSIHICLPPGHYVPRFVHRSDVEATSNEPQAVTSAGGLAIPGNGNSGSQAASLADAGTASPETADAAAARRPKWQAQAIAAAVVLLMAVSLALVPAWRRWGRKATSGAASQGVQLAATGAELDHGIRTLVGENRESYTDRAGFAWQRDSFCSGGTSFSVSERPIQGTEDPRLYTAGRSGVFQCRIPVPAGTYELHLLFAETAGLQENTRNVVFSINRGPTNSLDVVDDAAGDDIATVKVFAGIQPESDGAIHLDFTTSQSFLNAIEVVPGASGRVVPVRIVTGHSAYRDSQGNVWLPDRYAFGGRLSRSSGDMSNIADGGLYEWQRFGHFRYVIPVAPDRSYTLKLYFREPWFGSRNGNFGGVGSRVFDVSCNGSTLLKDFDILGEGGPDPLVRSFAHIQPTAQSKIEIYFTPVTNYPSVNAIEVIPE